MGETTTEFIHRLMKSLPEEEWDKILPVAIAYNRDHYKLDNSLVITMFESIKSSELYVRKLETDLHKG